MTPTEAAARRDRTIRRSATWTIAAAVVWVALALVNPSTTYHVAPLIVAAAAPVVLRAERGRRLSWREALGATVFSTAVAAGAAILLGLSDALRGPALVGSTGAHETVIALVCGATGGLLLAAIGRSEQA